MDAESITAKTYIHKGVSFFVGDAEDGMWWWRIRYANVGTVMPLGKGERDAVAEAEAYITAGRHHPTTSPFPPSAFVEARRAGGPDVLRLAIEHIEELESSRQRMVDISRTGWRGFHESDLRVTKLEAQLARYKLRVYPKDKPRDGVAFVLEFSADSWDLGLASNLEDGDIWLPKNTFDPTPEEIAEARKT